MCSLAPRPASQNRYRAFLRCWSQYRHVVGIITMLSLWFATHVLFADIVLVTFGTVALPIPDPANIHSLPLGLAVLASALIFCRRSGSVSVSAIRTAVSALADLF